MAVLLRVVRENDVVRSRQAWKKFELSLISGMAAFSLSFDASEPVPSKQFFTVDRAASLLMSTRVYPITESSVLVVVLFTAQPAQQSKKRGESSELNFTCVWESLHIVKLKWKRRRSSLLSSWGEGESWKFQVGTLLSDAVLFHDSSSIPPYLLWPADRHS